jgi:hypothetical protein
MKPVELVERALRNSSKTRDTILDPFGGSGTTLIACERANRQARVVELDPKYCDVIVRRWQDYTGGKAVLDGGGTFDGCAGAIKECGLNRTVPQGDCGNRSGDPRRRIPTFKGCVLGSLGLVGGVADH